jgi:sugar phosphate isomerase/epimerase
MTIRRREFLERSALLAAGAVLRPPGPQPAPAPLGPDPASEARPLFKISLAQWSLHRTLRSGRLDPLDFARVTRQEYGLDAVEYVNSFFKDKARDEAYLGRLKAHASEHAVQSLLIMVDGEGAIGDPDEAGRRKAVESHHRWVDAARFLGCHSIRVNAQSAGTPQEQRRLAADGLKRLLEYADPRDINVIVENHGGISSNGAWLASVITSVGHPRCGTLPDFGNFQLDESTWYDRYRGVRELMPFAKAVSAKSHDFDEQGNETGTDYRRMMKIVLDAGYRGYVGIEYEGERLSEPEGIRATKTLLERVRGEMEGEGTKARRHEGTKGRH